MEEKPLRPRWADQGRVFNQTKSRPICEERLAEKPGNRPLERRLQRLHRSGSDIEKDENFHSVRSPHRNHD